MSYQPILLHGPLLFLYIYIMICKRLLFPELIRPNESNEHWNDISHDHNHHWADLPHDKRKGEYQNIMLWGFGCLHFDWYISISQNGIDRPDVRRGRISSVGKSSASQSGDLGSYPSGGLTRVNQCMNESGWDGQRKSHIAWVSLINWCIMIFIFFKRKSKKIKIYRLNLDSWMNLLQPTLFYTCGYHTIINHTIYVRRLHSCCTMIFFYVISISLISSGDHVVLTTFCDDYPCVNYF